MDDPSRHFRQLLPNEGHEPFVGRGVVAATVDEGVQQRPFLSLDAEYETAGHGGGEAHERPPISDEQAYRNDDQE